MLATLAVAALTHSSAATAPSSVLTRLPSRPNRAPHALMPDSRS